MIECSHLSKHFRVYKKEPGILGSLKTFVSRKFERVTAVNDFSFVINEGELIGLLGPNGAGKTTLMKMLSGLIVPSSGSLRVLGFEPFQRHREFRKQIALVMGQKSQLWWDIPALDSFELLRAYYEVPRAEFSRRVEELASLLGVSAVLKTHVRKLSLGERMKMELMASLLHQPRVLFLDEPTIGLDVVAQVAIRKFLRDYHRSGRTTIILTSHYMADVEALCDRIILILGGEKRFDGSLPQFQRVLGSEKFMSISFASALPLPDMFWEPFHPVWNEERTQVEIRIAEDQLREVTQQIIERYPVTDFGTEKLPIERVMHSILSNPQLLPQRAT